MLYSLALIITMNILGYIFFHKFIGPIATDIGTALATTLAWSTATASIILIVAYYSLWEEQHNQIVKSDIAKKVWLKLDEVAIQLSELSLKMEDIWNISDDEFINILSTTKTEVNEINNKMLEILLNLQFLEALLNRKDLSEIIKSHYIVKLDSDTDMPTLIHKITNTYPGVFEPIQKELKLKLIKIIRA